MSYSATLARFLKTYQMLNKSNLHLLSEIYAENIEFCDPVHQVHGLDNLQAYFAKLYDRVISIDFDYGDVIEQNNKVSICWVMRFQHPRLARGNAVCVEGNTQLEFDDMGQVVSHHDYFDLGQLLYEHVPILGNAIGLLKRRLGA